MNLKQAAVRPNIGHSTCLSGVQLILARVLWGMGVALEVCLFFASIPPFFASLYIICAGSSCGSTQLTPLLAAHLKAQDLSVGFYATYTIGVNLIFALGYFGVAALILRYKSDDLMGLLASFGLATFVVAFIGSTQALPSQWQVLSQLLNFLSNVSFALFFYLFPNGQFVPRWLRWCTIVWIVYWVLQAFFPSSPVNPIVRFPVLNWVFPVLLGSILIGQIYRYRRISTKIERQQTKWVVFGLVVALVGLRWINYPTNYLSFIFPASLAPILYPPALSLFFHAPHSALYQLRHPALPLVGDRSHHQPHTDLCYVDSRRNRKLCTGCGWPGNAP